MAKILKLAILLIFLSKTVFAQESEFVDQVNEYLNELSKDENFGLSISISKNGINLLEGAYGYASRAHQVLNQASTKFNIASIGKLFTAVSILQLREQGKIELNKTVGHYLPQFPNQFIRDSTTIEQLLTHSSGLPLWFDESFDAKPKFEYLKLDDYLTLYEQVVIDKSKIGAHSYSNVGYITLGFIIAKVSKMSYREYLKQFIFEPLQMKETGIWSLTEIIPNVAIGYVRPSSKGDWWKTNYHLNKGGSPAGGAYSSSRDLLKFYNGLHSNKLMNEKSWQLMSSSKIKTSYGEYGYGIGISKKNNSIIIGHLGGYYGVRGELMWYEKSNYIISILANSDQTDYIDISYFIKIALAGTAEEKKAYQNTLDLLRSIDFTETAKAMDADAFKETGTFDETLIQIKGYYHYNNQDYDKAQKLFALNTLLFPDSSSALRDLKMLENN